MICADRLMLGVKEGPARHDRRPVQPAGQARRRRRVSRRFPIIHEWGGTVEFMILNDMIDEDTFRLHLVKAGQSLRARALRAAQPRASRQI